jgi:hypothetical protein
MNINSIDFARGHTQRDGESRHSRIATRAKSTILHAPVGTSFFEAESIAMCGNHLRQMRTKPLVQNYRPAPALVSGRWRKTRFENLKRPIASPASRSRDAKRSDLYATSSQYGTVIEPLSQHAPVQYFGVLHPSARYPLRTVKRNTMLINTLRQATGKTPMQNPLDPDVCNILRASAQIKECKNPRSAFAQLPEARLDFLPLTTSGFVGIYCMRLQIFQVTKRETRFMRCRQNNLRSVPSIERFLPPRCAEAPLVARLQPGKPKLQIGRRQVVSGRLREGQEFGCQNDANRVRPDILRPGIAAAIPEKAGHRRSATSCQLAAEHVFGLRNPNDAVRGGNSNHNGTCFQPLFWAAEPSAGSGVWYNVRRTFRALARCQPRPSL